MRLGINLGYSGAQLKLPFDLIQEADRQGVYAVWTAEAWGSDAVTPLAWIGAHTERIRLGTAIMQIPARTPSMTAMTAMTLDQLSGGRFLLGLGVSGPQVVEGWHGVAYGKPLGRTRETVQIVRSVFERTGPISHTGAHYQIPYQGTDATGLGKPLKSILHGPGEYSYLPRRYRTEKCAINCRNREWLASDPVRATPLRRCVSSTHRSGICSHRP